MTTFKRLCLLLCLALVAGPIWAEESPFQVYKELKQAREAGNDAWRQMLNGDADPKTTASVSRKLEESSVVKGLETKLKSMADAGNVAAMYYWGAYLDRSGTTAGKIEALDYYKQAANLGSPESAWNVAELYKTGGAGTTSKLAAIEWFYKAGTLHAKYEEREQALAALEEMQALDKGHFLSKKLAKQLGAQ